MGDNALPVTIVATPNSGVAGKQVSIKVTLNVAPSADQAVAITSSAGFFTSIPGQVTVTAGSVSATFNATVDRDATGTATVTASCNGGHADGTLSAT